MVAVFFLTLRILLCVALWTASIRGLELALDPVSLILGRYLAHAQAGWAPGVSSLSEAGRGRRG